jgi:nicotinamide-nucleotide amidase
MNELQETQIQHKVARLHELFAEKRWTLGFAESCTGGLLSAFVSGRSGISQIFKGSVVTYHADAKRKILRVPESEIQKFGEVSVEVALSMAYGARVSLECDWAVAITGIAGPTGGTPTKPVGTVCFAVVGPDFEGVSRQQFGEAHDRRKIQLDSVEFAIDFLWDSQQKT